MEKIVKGELVRFQSREYTYPVRSHTDTPLQDTRSYGSEGDLVRYVDSKGKRWLLLRDLPHLGLPETEWRELARHDRGALKFTGWIVTLKLDVTGDVSRLETASIYVSPRLRLSLQMNGHFNEAYRKREKWALERAEQIFAIDSPSTRRGDEPRNHCGSCPFAEGCMVCDLPYDSAMKPLVGHHTEPDNPNRQ